MTAVLVTIGTPRDCSNCGREMPRGTKATKTSDGHLSVYAHAGRCPREAATANEPVEFF